MNQPVEAPKAPSTLPAPREIIIKETGALVAFACPNESCGLLFLFQPADTEEDRQYKHTQASTHCVKQCICGKPLDYHYNLRCAACRAENKAKKQQLLFENAQKVSIEKYPDHPIFWDGQSGDMGGDGYFSGIDALLDHCESEGLEVPDYAWACTRREFALDARELVFSACEGQDIDPEATRVDDKALAALQKSLDTWIEGQASKLHAWFQDTTRAVVLRDAEERG